MLRCVIETHSDERVRRDVRGWPGRLRVRRARCGLRLERERLSLQRSDVPLIFAKKYSKRFLKAPVDQHQAKGARSAPQSAFTTADHARTQYVPIPTVTPTEALKPLALASWRPALYSQAGADAGGSGTASGAGAGALSPMSELSELERSDVDASVAASMLASWLAGSPEAREPIRGMVKSPSPLAV